MKKYVVSSITFAYICVLHIAFISPVFGDLDEDPEEVAEVLIDNYKDKEFTDPECNAATVVLTIDPDGNTVVNEIEPGDCELVKSDDDIKTNKEVIKKVIEDLNKKPPVISTPTPVPTPKPKVTLPKTTTPTQITTPRKKNIVKKTPIPNTNTATIQQKKDDISQRILLEKDDENEDETKKNENDAIYRSTGADMSIIAKNLSKKYIKTHNSAKTTTLVSTQLDARDIQAGLQIDDQNILLEVLNHAMIDTVTKEIDAMDGAKVSSIFADIAPELLRVELDTSVMTTQSLIADIDEKYLDEVDTYNNIIIPVEPISERDAVYRNQSSGNKSEDDQHQRYLDFLGLEEGLCTVGSNPVPIAIVDNAFESDHDDLVSSVMKKYDVGDKDTDVSPINPNNTVYNHGTVQAGIIGGEDNDFGITGIAAGSDMIFIKASRDKAKGGTITDGIIGVAKAYEEGAKVINISRGAFSNSAMLEKVTKKIADTGVIIVAAAGNYNSSDEFYPAAYKHVLAVAALDQNGQKAKFSNYGPRVNLSAPGVDMYTTDLNNKFGSYSGTSEASPAVAAGIALAMSYGLDTSDVLKNLTKSNDAGVGRGMLNLSFICEEAQKAKKTPPKVHAVAQETNGTNRLLIGGGLLILLGIIGGAISYILHRND